MAPDGSIDMRPPASVLPVRFWRESLSFQNDISEAIVIDSAACGVVSSWCSRRPVWAGSWSIRWTVRSVGGLRTLRLLGLYQEALLTDTKRFPLQSPVETHK